MTGAGRLVAAGAAPGPECGVLTGSRADRHPPVVQISLDLTDLDEALETARIAVEAGVDWLEAGTPLLLAEGLRAATLLLHPYMPDTTGRLLDALGEEGRGLAEFGSRGGGQSLGKLDPLFPKLDP